MDKAARKQVIDQYKQQKVTMGVYQLRNRLSGKLFIESASNLKSRELTLRMMLDDGRHPNGQLQEDWNKHGSDTFEYSVLEQVEVEQDASPAERKKQLDEMMSLWLDEIEPYDEAGYNKRAKA
ncbi:MAG: GIY-YIG nuclease family protein [Coriobacteriales bacterium]|jgi:hypothetical protein|nr:GIY-YIG nuclease family protein [Coriobacteriales bacterium]